MGLKHPFYDVSHYVLAALYFAFALFQIVVIAIKCARQERRELFALWKIWFYVMLLGGTCVRACWIILQPLIMEGDIQPANLTNFTLNTVPSFLLFTCYIIMLLLWAEIYHYPESMAREGTLQVRRLRPHLGVSLALMYALVTSLYVADYLVYPPHFYSISQSRTPLEGAITLCEASLYCVCAIGFLVYGLRVYAYLRKKLVQNVRRKRLLTKLGIITGLFCTCFTIRCIIVALAAFDKTSFTLWFFDLVYFGGLELVPLIIILTVFLWKPSSSSVVPVNGLSLSQQQQQQRQRTAYKPLKLQHGDEHEPLTGRTVIYYSGSPVGKVTS